MSQGAPDARAEETCGRCGGPNIVWSAPSPLWNEVMRGGDINGEEIHGGVVCPMCFASLAERVAGATLWRFDARRVDVPLQMVTPSGRVWNPVTWMWDTGTASDEEPADELYEHRDDPDEWSEEAVEVESRPKGTEVVSFRLPVEEVDALEDAAAAAGETLSGFLRQQLEALQGSASDDEIAWSQAQQLEAVRGAAWANGLERDEANERLEGIADLIRMALGNVALTRSQMSQLQEVQKLARPARLVKVAAPTQPDPAAAEGYKRARGAAPVPPGGIDADEAIRRTRAAEEAQ